MTGTVCKSMLTTCLLYCTIQGDATLPESLGQSSAESFYQWRSKTSLDYFTFENSFYLLLNLLHS